MSMDLNQINQQVQVRVASPQLVAANHILALSSAELQSFIYHEMSENPALDMEETPVCPQCGRPLQGPVCQVCQQRQQLDIAKTRLDSPDYGDDGSGWQGSLRSNNDDEFDPAARVAAQMSLAEHLTLSLQAQFPDE